MARSTSRSNDWGFPRWRGYGSAREATTVRLCDRHGCEAPGNCPAPKSPNSPDRWYFCEAHAAEYNRGWNYFEGLSAEEAAAREQSESRTASGYANASHYAWGGPGDGTRSRDELRAL
ncbi:MAG: molecular chaperone DnaJ, partial [Sphingomonas sp.]